MKKIEIPLLRANDIEVKVKQVSEKGAVALLYKTARVDYRILDQVFGTFGWKCEYQEIKGNLFCIISLWDEETKQWVAKSNCGIESRADDEGNEKKGEASDALKRAGFSVGIGTELYSAPFTFLKVETVKNGEKYFLKDKFAKFSVSQIDYNENREITKLEIVNQNGELVYSYGFGKKTAPKGDKHLNTATQSECEDLSKISLDEPITEKTKQQLNSYVVCYSEERKVKFKQFMFNKYGVSKVEDLKESQALKLLEVCKK